MQAGEFVKKVRQRAGLENNENAMALIDAFFTTLRARITHESGDNVAAQLPHDLQSHWEKGFFDHLKRRFTGTERMDLQEFIDRVQKEAHLGTTCNAEYVTRSLITTFREAISPGADSNIVDQLPGDIKDFWLSCVPDALRPEVTAVKTVSAPSEPAVSTEAAAPMSYVTPTSYTASPGGAAQTEYTGQTAVVAEPGTEKIEEPVGAQTKPPFGEYGPDLIGPAAASVERSDDQLIRDINDLLAANPHIHSDMVNVEVHAGKVILTGTVPNQDEKLHVADITSRVLGVTEVENNLAPEQEKEQ